MEFGEFWGSFGLFGVCPGSVWTEVGGFILEVQPIALCLLQGSGNVGGHWGPLGRTDLSSMHHFSPLKGGVMAFFASPLF